MAVIVELGSEVWNIFLLNHERLCLNQIALRMYGKHFNELEHWQQSSVSEKFEEILHGVNVHKKLFDAVNISKEIKEENMSLFDKENQRKIEDENLQKRIYTQLAREGKFDNLPDTCEFSEPVELEVWNDGYPKHSRLISGKFKGFFVFKNDLADSEFWHFKHAQLPTPKIDFSQFKSGDVVEVELVHNETRIGWFDYVDNDYVVINVLKREGNQVCNLGSCAVDKEKIKSITKLK